MNPMHEDDPEVRRWVRYHVTAYFVIIGVAVGLIIVDAKIGEIVGAGAMRGFRTILLLSILLAGLGARALLAWRSATVDLQGRIFLTATGLILLTGAAIGFSDCMQEFWGHFKIWEERRSTSAGQARRSAFDVPAQSLGNFVQMTPATSNPRIEQGQAG
jgi:hypothetical protein